MSHQAVLLEKKRALLVIRSQTTPTPGPNQVVVAVKNIALNPVDHIQISMGFNISRYPYVLGFDVAGTIHTVGPSVEGLAIGDRVLALASNWFEQKPEYGGFQEYVLVNAETVTPIPDSLPFSEACILPLAVYTAWFSFLVLGVPRTALYQDTDKKGILIWGAGGSVGSLTLQVARSMGFYIYATASPKHHAYLQSLGKGPGKVSLFDYKDKQVKANIIQATKDDGVVVDCAIESCAGNLKDIVSVLNQTKGSTRCAKVACAPFSFSMLWYTKFCPSFISGVDAKFVEPPKDDVARKQALAFIYNSWLPLKLANGEVVPSPKVQLVPNGLQGIQEGLDLLKQGVSGVKLTVEL